MWVCVCAAEVDRECLFDFYLVCFNSQSCSQSAALLWLLIAIRRRYASRVKFTLPFGTNPSTWNMVLRWTCSSVKQRVIPGKGPSGTKTEVNQGWHALQLYPPWFSREQLLKISSCLVKLGHQSFHILCFKTSCYHTHYSANHVATRGFLYEFLSGMQWFGIMRCSDICADVLACILRLCWPMNKFGDSSPW